MSKTNDHKNYEAHLFVCTNSRETGESCSQKGSLELREAVKKACQDPERHLHGKVRINASGCLGQCEKGIVAVLYPQGIWKTGLKKESAGELLELVTHALNSKKES